MSAAADPERLPLPTLLVYALPTISLGFTGSLISMYLLKFSTDVLLIAPGLVGLLFGIARIWDAISDPIAGYWSDRTRTRLGRRRPWLIAAALPMGLVFAGLWSPPASLDGGALVLWMGAGILLFYTAQTAVSVPHLALGAELTRDYHDRSRVFGVRQLLEFAGILLAAGALSLMELADDRRGAAAAVALVGAAATVALVLVTAARTRERPDHQGRGARRAGAAFRDVLRNPHARVLLAVFFLDQLGFAILITMLPYLTEYLLGEQGTTGIYVASAIGTALVFYPIWIPLSRRFGKRNPWIAANAIKAAGYGLLFFIGPGDRGLILIATVLIGSVQGAAGILGSSIQADVIDWDEVRTGERKEGAYFALWNMATKAAAGFAIVFAGFLLDAAGFRPNAEQGASTLLAIRGLTAGLPFAFAGLTTVLLLRFRLDARAHREIRAALASSARPTHRVAGAPAAPAPGPPGAPPVPAFRAEGR